MRALLSFKLAALAMAVSRRLSLLERYRRGIIIKVECMVNGVRYSSSLSMVDD